MNAHPNTIDHPRYARNDPDTSRIAAERIEQSGAMHLHRQICAEAVRKFPGRTSAELAKLDPRLTRDQYARRLCECGPYGVRKGDSRKCTDRGSMALTWWPTDAMPVTKPAEVSTMEFTFTRGNNFAVSDCGRYRIEWARTRPDGPEYFNCWFVGVGPRKHIHGGFDRAAAKQACIEHAAKLQGK